MTGEMYEQVRGVDSSNGVQTECVVCLGEEESICGGEEERKEEEKEEEEEERHPSVSFSLNNSPSSSSISSMKYFVPK